MHFINKKFQYFLINNKSQEILSQEKDILNIVYDNWIEIWKDVFHSKNENNSINTEDIFRPNYVASIFSNSELVAFHLYTFFDLKLKSSLNHPYFHSLNPNTFDFLDNQNLSKIMTMEYLTVLPNFRKKESGINWGEVIISLGQKLLYETNCSACFGTARKDVKVNKMGEKLGFITTQAPIQKYDYECEVMISIRGNELEHPDPNTRNLIQNLWNNRIDFQKNKKPSLKVA